MDREHALYAFIVFQVCFDIIMIGLFFVYTNNFLVIGENQDNFLDSLNQMSKITGMVSTIVPDITRAHNNMVEGLLTGDPELIETGKKFRKAMARVAEEGKLDRFYNCSPTNFTRYQVNFPLFDDGFGNPRNIIGYETVTYNMDDDFKHVESLYVSKEWIVYEKLGCARITYMPAEEDKLNFQYYEDVD